MKILYYDCFAGISGDMNLGVLLDLGVDKNYLISELNKLAIDGFHLEVKKDQRRGISGTKVEVLIKNQENAKHRHYKDIIELINESGLNNQVKINALKIFELIAAAESKVHNISKEKVHFHEVGALDSIVDIVGAAICLDDLEVDKILSSPIQLGGGTVKCAHGIIPVPAPATAEILTNIPVKTGLVNHEATTPTGAAILAAMVDEFTDKNEFSIIRTGYGIGHRDTEVPNVLRAFLCKTIESHDEGDSEDAILLECNIDDMNPEHYEFILDQLFTAGASDAWLMPIIMKKTRPAVTLSILCHEKLINKMKDIVFTHSTSIGVREQKVKKNMLHREESTIDTIYGKIRIKQSFYKGKLHHSKPEYEDCKKLAKKHHISISDIEKAIKIESGRE